jgi:hypothetical protein
MNNLAVKNEMRVSSIIRQFEAEMTEEQILMDRYKDAGRWDLYGNSKKRFAALWDELNRVKRETENQPQQ